MVYPLVNIQKAMENGHRNRGFSQLENGGSFHCYVSSPEGIYPKQNHLLWGKG